MPPAGPHAPPDLGPQVELAIRRIGVELVGCVDEVTARVAAHVVEVMPELGAEADGRVVTETVDSGRANIGAIASMFAYGIPAASMQAPHGAVEFARAMIRRGVELPAILRAYRVGHRALWDAWLDLVSADLADDPVLFTAVLRETSAVMFDYMDAVCVRLVEECDTERRRWARSAAAARAATARTLLDGTPSDVDAASRALRYELGRHHLALILWGELTDDDAAGDPVLEHEATAIAAVLGCPDPLLVPAGRGVLWAWAGSYDVFDPAALEALSERDCDATVRVAAGEPGPGVEGFRRSHAQADRALRVLTLTGARPGVVVRYETVAFLSTLCADPQQARAFAELELGPLSGDGALMATLRTTLAAYLDTGSSHVRAARRLGVHEKTITTRVRRAEELLGHRVDTRRSELASALLILGSLPTEPPGRIA